MIGKIYGTGSSLPKRIVSNDDLAKIVDTNDTWIRERTGVARRRIIKEETTVSMATEAAQKALEQSGIAAEEVDLILVSTISSEVILPCTACEVQKNIKAVNAAAFDINASCAGFLFGYNTAQAYIAAGMAKTVLVIGSESLSNLVNWKDRSTCILFGDGAGAAVLKAEKGKLLPSVSHSDGKKGEALTCLSRHRKGSPARTRDLQAYMQMDGQSVFKFAVKKVPKAVKEVLEEAGLKADDIDYFILHQANRRIVEAVAKRLKTDIEKFPMNLEEYGNTSSASIPILLDEMNRKGKFVNGQKIILAGFGAGLSWGAALLEW